MACSEARFSNIRQETFGTSLPVNLLSGTFMAKIGPTQLQSDCCADCRCGWSTAHISYCGQFIGIFVYNCTNSIGNPTANKAGVPGLRSHPRLVGFMDVAIDTNGLYVTKAGTARYVRGLLRGFKQLDLPSLNVSELAWPVENFGYRQPLRMLKTFYRELLWAKFVAPRKLTRRGVDLFHATSALMVTPPPRLSWVMTLLDVAVLRHPERFRKWHLYKTRRD